MEYFKWDEAAYEYVACDKDDPEAEPFEWCETACEWIYSGDED